MKIVGLTGFAKSGKSTAAEILKTMGGQELAFAKHLKDVCSVVLHVPRHYFDDQAFKEKPFTSNRFSGPIYLHRHDIESILEMFEVERRYVAQAVLTHMDVELNTPRHIAQYVGTEILRSINTNIHIDMAFKLNKGKGDLLVCSDVRFANELMAVQQASGLMIGISRLAAMPKDLINLHPSEKEIPVLISKSNFIVENETSVEKFQETIKNLANEYLNGQSF